MQDNAFTNKVKTVWAFIKKIAARVWAYLKVAKMEWIVLIGLFAFDLISKAIVEAAVDYGGVVTLIPNFLNVHRIHNYAAAFGSDFIRSWFGDIGSRIFFCVFAVAASVALTILLIKNKGKSKWFRVSLALFIAGAMGNCIDRMFLGYVRDFVEFVFFGQTWFGRKTWYVFNIADAELVIGVIMIVIYFLFLYKDSNKKKNNELLTDELGEIEPIDNTAAVCDGDSTSEEHKSEDAYEASESDEQIPPSEKENISPENDDVNGKTVQTIDNSVEIAAVTDESSMIDKEPVEKISTEKDELNANNGGADERVGNVSDKSDGGVSAKPKSVRKRTRGGGSSAK